MAPGSWQTIRIYTSASLAERLRRYVQVVVLSEGVGSSPTGCIFFCVWLVVKTRRKKKLSTTRGFEPRRAKPINLAG